MTHRLHKKAVTLDVARHNHGDLLTGRYHTHAWASYPHAHILRAVCQRPECKSFETHNIHAAPTDVVPANVSDTTSAQQGEDIWPAPTTERGN